MPARLHESARALYAEHGGTAIRYGIVGVSGYLLSIALFAAQVAAGVSPYAAVPLGFVINTMWNFTLNRRWSFPASGRPLADELKRFCVVALTTLAGNYIVLWLLHDVAGIASVPSQALAILIIVPIGYLGQRYWAFGAA
jgi:dolichol-phosphate mannosyltransferase